ncbi:unnamed protein product [Closterium sp. Naga37s-1]|nr:unnamed protein product [Closterium sp. Naga37s-1]
MEVGGPRRAGVRRVEEGERVVVYEARDAMRIATVTPGRSLQNRSRVGGAAVGSRVRAAKGGGFVHLLAPSPALWTKVTCGEARFSPLCCQHASRAAGAQHGTLTVAHLNGLSRAPSPSPPPGAATPHADPLPARHCSHHRTSRRDARRRGAGERHRQRQPLALLCTRRGAHRPPALLRLPSGPRGAGEVSRRGEQVVRGREGDSTYGGSLPWLLMVAMEAGARSTWQGGEDEERSACSRPPLHSSGAPILFRSDLPFPRTTRVAPSPLCRAEFEANGIAGVASVQVRDIQGDGFPPHLHASAHAAFLDLPCPWLALPSAAACLVAGGRVCSFSPCMEQVQRCSLAMRAHGLTDIRTVELLTRTYDVRQEALAVPHLHPASEAPSLEPPGEGNNGRASEGDGGQRSNGRVAKRRREEGGGDEDGGMEQSTAARAEGGRQDGDAMGEAGAAGRGRREVGRRQRGVGESVGEERRYVAARPVAESKGHTGYLTFATKPV